MPTFADRLPSYEFLVFELATGAFLGSELLLRPDIYQQGDAAVPATARRPVPLQPAQ
jgi:hypothetical protein